MPQRLPTPGGDDGTWGNILNGYLEVSHNPDGTLANNVVGTNQIQSSAVTNTQLDTPTQSAITKANSSVQTVNTHTPTNGSVTLTASDVSAVPTSQLGVASGVATLNSSSQLTNSQLPSSVVSGAADYLIIPTAAGGCQAFNKSTGAVDFSTASTTDHAPVFQSCVNTLQVAKGGKIEFKGQFTFATQLIIYPNIALVGQGPTGYVPGSAYGSIISSTFNGSCILITGDARASTFPYLANFTLYGSNTLAAQNGIEWNNSGGQDVRDTLLDNVLVFHMGQHGWLIGGTGVKILATKCYFEYCTGNGITHNGSNGYLLMDVVYILGQTGNGYDGSGSTGGHQLYLSSGSINNCTGKGIVPPYAGSWQLTNLNIASNTAGGIYCTYNVTAATVTGCILNNNGGVAAAQFFAPQAANGGSLVTVTANVFTGGTGYITNHVVVAGSNVYSGSFSDNGFYGHTGDAIVWSSRTGNNLIIRNNRHYNDTKGKITNPFNASGRIGAAGTVAAPVASTVYAVEGTDLMLAVSGGTAVSITITDAAANVVQSGLTTYTGTLPIGYSINFGAFTAAPTVYAGVV